LKKLKTNKRQKFLEKFFSTLGAYQVQWIFQDEACIAGTIVYEPSGPDEQQDFIWYRQENKTPSKEVEKVLAHLKEYKLLHLDKLKVAVAEIVIPAMNDQAKMQAFQELFKVKVILVDDGKEAGFYLIHE
jgi:stress response protein SCP2